jgi:hypothetical protein
MQNLSLDGGKIDQPKKVPFDDLLAAGTAALAKVGKEVGEPGLGWVAIADDPCMMPEFCDWADIIPLIAGTCFSGRASTPVPETAAGTNGLPRRSMRSLPPNMATREMQSSRSSRRISRTRRSRMSAFSSGDVCNCGVRAASL